MVTHAECRSDRQEEVLGYKVLLDDQWCGWYASEFRAAMEYIRYMGFEQAMREALDAIGAGEVQIPAYRNI